ncbi:MAG: hypothetical protein J0653_05225 [Deltaproteobacteria bacterium]|nr:hypothetical protein [Deltaproteobacteria bacterium]
MNRQQVAKTWINYGLTDLYFAFDSDDDAFSDNVLFSEIMGLEKFLKAVLLFHLHQEYEGLTYQDAKEKINNLAKSKKMSHNFEAMFSELSKFIPDNVARIMESDSFPITLENNIIDVEEFIPVQDSGTIEYSAFTHDPLWSSGITKFIYAVCNVCFASLSSEIDFTDLINQFSQRFSHKESLLQFNNLFWVNNPLNGTSLCGVQFHAD